MTYENIYQKFMIEYDKAGITSSYPSLTEYEAATILDKAYLALIALKVTGNNPRRSTFESDTKAVSDLLKLISHKNISEEDGSLWPEEIAFITNAVMFDLPEDFMYFISAQMLVVHGDVRTYNPIKLIPHESAEKFYQTEYNMPWIKIPVCYIENDKIIVLYDKEAVKANTVNPTGIQTVEEDSMYITYIKEPKKFANSSNSTLNTQETITVEEGGQTTSSTLDIVFECSDSMAEELISLAVTFALENVESSRLNTKLNTRGLEA